MGHHSGGGGGMGRKPHNGFSGKMNIMGGNDEHVSWIVCQNLHLQVESFYQGDFCSF